MRSVESSVYTEDYYLHTCLGSEEFSANNGRSLHKKVLSLLSSLAIKKTDRILDVGCGRGDMSLYLAKNAAEVIGIDYAKAAISIANKTKLSFPSSVQKKTTFHRMDIKDIRYPDNYFDYIICIDVLEHLYPEEAELALSELYRVLNPTGTLLLVTAPNKILYDYVYPYYIFPINVFLTWIDQKIKGVQYSSFSSDPRTPEEKIQHVNEPTYFYLKRMMRKYHFSGEILCTVGFLKEITSLKSYLYNFVITLYPLSKLFPLSLLFAVEFICHLYKNKEIH